MPDRQPAGVILRPPTPDDQDECGRILFEAFDDIAKRHGFPPDFPNLEAGRAVIGFVIDSSWGVVAERDGRVLGSNFLKEGDPVAALGPISVDPALQESGIGRLLMQAAIERGQRSHAVRLVQDAFNSTSMALYASLGFDVREPLALLTGTPAPVETSASVRPLEAEGVDACAELCRRIHGIDRSAELAAAVGRIRPYVLERDGRICAYASSLAFWPGAHGVADSDENLCALIAGAAQHSEQAVNFLLPTRLASVFRWALGAGLRIVKPMTLMSLGPYREPAGSFFPSVGY